jgi:YVTN family beta-propeller protein
VVNAASHSVSVIALSAGAVVKTIRVGQIPTGVAIAR